MIAVWLSIMLKKIMRELFNRLQPDGRNILFNQYCQLATFLSGLVCFVSAFLAWDIYRSGGLRQGQSTPPPMFLVAVVAIWFALVVLVGAKMRNWPSSNLQSAALHVFLTATILAVFMCVFAFMI